MLPWNNPPEKSITGYTQSVNYRATGLFTLNQLSQVWETCICCFYALGISTCVSCCMPSVSLCVCPVVSYALGVSICPVVSYAMCISMCISCCILCPGFLYVYILLYLMPWVSLYVYSLLYVIPWVSGYVQLYVIPWVSLFVCPAACYPLGICMSMYCMLYLIPWVSLYVYVVYAVSYALGYLSMCISIMLYLMPGVSLCVCPACCILCPGYLCMLMSCCILCPGYLCMRMSCCILCPGYVCMCMSCQWAVRITGILCPRPPSSHHGVMCAQRSPDHQAVDTPSGVCASSSGQPAGPLGPQLWSLTPTGPRRERENSNSKTLFYRDCSLGSVKPCLT